jgi:hypothetical protein
MGMHPGRLVIPLLLSTMFIPLSLAPEPTAGPDNWYIAPDGDDADPCTFAAPCATLDRAAEIAGPGDTVYARGGEYTVTGTHRIEGIIGTEAEPVTFRAFPGETPFLNATGAPIDDLDSVVKIVSVRHVAFEGFSVCCSSGRGISVSDSQFVTVAHNDVWEIQTRGIGGHGENITIAYNTVDRAVLENEDRNATSGWTSGIASWSQWDGSPSRNWTFLGNMVTRAYGECLNVLRVIGFTVRDNYLDGCFSVDLYVDKSKQGTIVGNVLQSTVPGFEWLPSGVRPNALMFAAESSSVQITPSHIGVAWNIMGPGVHVGIKWWPDPGNTEPWNSYRDLTIVNNRIVGVDIHAAQFPQVPAGRDPPCCSIFAWNEYEGALDFGDPGAWSVQDNRSPGREPPLPPRLDHFR